MSCLERQNELVPVFSTSFLAEHFLVEPCADAADGAFVLVQHRRNFHRFGANLQEEAHLVLRGREAAQGIEAAAEVGVNDL